MNHCFLKTARVCIVILMVLAVTLSLTGCSRKSNSGGSKTYTVSGEVVDGNGVGIEGVNIVVTGGVSASTTTENGGKYTFTGLTGTCTLTPVLEEYIFEPNNRVVSKDSSNVNFTAEPETVEVDYFDFNNSTGTITKFYIKGKHNNLDENKNPVIPPTINGKPVRTIGEYAFQHAQIESVVIPSSVTTIEKWAFNNNLLTSVDIPDTVVTIGEYAFTGNQLTNITIPDGITVIARGVFWLNKLTSVTIHDNVTEIGSSAFEDNLLAEITIPNSVISIGGSAFSGNPLTELVIPDSVEVIGRGAFESNYDLTRITIPSNVTIDGHAFYQGYYYTLSTIIIGENVELGDDLLGENNDFRTAYAAGGAGTYEMNMADHTWVKQ